MNIFSYDYFVNKHEILLEKDKFVFSYLNKNILYIKSGQKIISINLESIYFGTGKFKDFLETLFFEKIVVFPNYKMAVKVFSKNVLDNTIFLENMLKILNDKTDLSDFIIKEIKNENYFSALEYLDNTFQQFLNLNTEEKRCYKNFLIKDIATKILCDSYMFADTNIENFTAQKNGLFAKKLNYSNKRTLTGRITCTDKFNIQMMPKESELRKHIISRYTDGFMVNFDYSSFETVLSMYLTNDDEFIKKYLDLDIHDETAKVIFEKQKIDRFERDFAKKINHSIVYGAGKKTILDCLVKFDNKENIYENINSILEPILKSKNGLIKSFKEKKYIINYFGTFIYPQKEHAIYNNYIQSIAADIIARKIIEVNELLIGYKSKIVSSIIDSIIVDFHPTEEFLISEITKIMENVNSFKLKISCEKMQNLSQK